MIVYLTCSLYFLFGAKLIQALDLLDKNLVQCVVSHPSNRVYWQVSGGTKTHPENYLCFPHYCSCTNFTFSAGKKDELLCVRAIVAWNIDVVVQTPTCCNFGTSAG